MSKKKNRLRTTTKAKDATPKLGKALHHLSILSLAIAFLLFSIGIPLVQMKIDKCSSYQEAYQIQVLQVFFKQKYRQDEIDLNSFLNILIEEKFSGQEYMRIANRMKEIINKRHREYTVMALALLLSDPSDKAPDFKTIMDELDKQPLENLLQQYKEIIDNKPSEISAKIARKLSFWTNARNLNYALAGFIFILGTVLQILSKRND